MKVEVRSCVTAPRRNRMSNKKTTLERKGKESTGITSALDNDIGEGCRLIILAWWNHCSLNIKPWLTSLARFAGLA